ncbi:hypothetical protein AMECASPLE_018697 [Ameca splendens]|uniref:Uncharacterized protein n=1 Tax=Ameca splendens TaxID=208324 RepID=A0ABV0Z2Q0_9TELE
MTIGAAELAGRRCDRCSSLTHQFRGLYEGGSPALLHVPQPCSLLKISRKPLITVWTLDSFHAVGPPAYLSVWLSEPCPPSYGSSGIIKKPQWNQHYLTVPDSQPSPPWWIAPPKYQMAFLETSLLVHLINSLNISLFECSLHVGQIGLKNDDTS